MALTIQPETADDCLGVVKNGGRVTTVSGNKVAVRRGISVTQFSQHADTRQKLASPVRELTDALIKLVIERTYSFDAALAVLEKTETRHARGKVVVELSVA